ncbi:MAG: sugar kinase [Actinobacteria bacterium]|nr:sugar kinase [Actinomycetota bacterium]
MSEPIGEGGAEVPGEREQGAPSGRLISFGGLLADLIVGVDAVPARGEDTLARDFTQTVGGGFAVIAAAARLGMPAALAGVLGDDHVADVARRALAEEGVELLFPEPRAGGSGVCLVMVDASGERTMVTVQGVESRVQSEDFDAVAPAPGDFVYVNGYELLYSHAAGLVSWLRRVRPDALVFDPGPLIAEIDRDTVDAVLAATSWLSLNVAEAGVLTGEEDPSAAAAAALTRIGANAANLRPDPAVDGPKTRHMGKFSAHRHGVVVRIGAEGCVVLAEGGTPTAVPGFAVATVDTTGAGDTHVGAFVAALARGLEPVEAARWANAAAAHVVATRGQVSPPRPEELRAILASARP